MVNKRKTEVIKDLGLILLIPLLPFLYQADYYFNQILIVFFILFVCCIHKLLLLKKVSVSGTDIILLLFLSVCLLNVWLIRQWDIDELEYYKWGALVAAYFVARTFDRKNINILFWSIVISGIFQSIVGLFQYIGLVESGHPYFKMTGYFSNPALLGCYLAVALTAACYLLTNIKTLSGRLFLSTAAAFIVPVLILSDSRAAWLASISGILFIVYKTHAGFSCVRIRFKNKVAYMLAGIVVISITAWGLYSYKKDSADVRLLIWTVSKDIICDAPATGHGINRFPAIYMDYQGKYFKKNPESIFRSVSDNNTQTFNEYLRITCETGFIGFVIILALFFSVFARKRIFVESFPLVVMSVFSIFSYPCDFFTTSLLFPLFIGISRHDRIYAIELKHKPFVIVGACLVGVCIMVNGLYSFKAYNTAFYQLETEMPRIVLKNNIKYMASYSKILFDQGRYEEFIRYTDDKSFPFMTSVVKCDIGIVYWKTGNFKKAEDAFKEACYMSPSKILPQYLLFSLYKESGNRKEAFHMAENILKRNVQVAGSIAIKANKEAKSYINGDHFTDKK